MTKEDIARQTAELLVSVDIAILEESLTGIGSPLPVAANRLSAFVSMLTNADLLRAAGDISACYDQLSSALGKCDGEESPFDFVQGTSRVAIAGMITALMVVVNAEDVKDQAYCGLKSQKRI